MRAAGILGCVAWLAAPCAAAAQSGPGTTLATREALRAEVARLERGSAQDRATANLVRMRLESGDFQPGDRIYLRVEGEAQLTDTFTVNTAGDLELPQLGSMPLRGVLRSEVQGRLREQLARYLRNPVVQVRPLLRLLIDGEVVHPGFYMAAPQEPLADVITQAGGLTPRAKPLDIRIERGPQRIWTGETLRPALGAGYSLDQLSLRAGDRVLVPGRGESGSAWRVLGFLVSLPLAVVAITHIR